MRKDVASLVAVIQPMGSATRLSKQQGTLGLYGVLMSYLSIISPVPFSVPLTYADFKPKHAAGPEYDTDGEAWADSTVVSDVGILTSGTSRSSELVCLKPAMFRSRRTLGDSSFSLSPLFDQPVQLLLEALQWQLTTRQCMPRSNILKPASLSGSMSMSQKSWKIA